MCVWRGAVARGCWACRRHSREECLPWISHHLAWNIWKYLVISSPGTCTPQRSGIWDVALRTYSFVSVHLRCVSIWGPSQGFGDLKLPPAPKWIVGLPWWLIWLRICLKCRRPRFPPWFGKLPWRRKWQPTPVCLENSMDRGAWWATVYTVQGRKEPDTTEGLTLWFSQCNVGESGWGDSEGPEHYHNGEGKTQVASDSQRNTCFRAEVRDRILIILRKAWHFV